MTGEETLQLGNGDRREKPFAIEKIGEMKDDKENEDALGPAPDRFQPALHAAAKERKSEM